MRRKCTSKVIFFFKQKTAYEMRISDWSSDVCSSDLQHRAAAGSEASPEAHSRLRIVAGAAHQPHRQPVGLDLGLAEQPGAAAETLEQPAVDVGGVEPLAVAEDIVRQFVRHRGGQRVAIGGEAGGASTEQRRGGK